jgi:hypothetical protein
MRNNSAQATSQCRIARKSPLFGEITAWVDKDHWSLMRFLIQYWSDRRKCDRRIMFEKLRVSLPMQIQRYGNTNNVHFQPSKKFSFWMHWTFFCPWSRDTFQWKSRKLLSDFVLRDDQRIQNPRAFEWFRSEGRSTKLFKESTLKSRVTGESARAGTSGEQHTRYPKNENWNSLCFRTYCDRLFQVLLNFCHEENSSDEIWKESMGTLCGRRVRVCLGCGTQRQWVSLRPKPLEGPGQICFGKYEEAHFVLRVFLSVIKILWSNETFVGLKSHRTSDANDPVICQQVAVKTSQWGLRSFQWIQCIDGSSDSTAIFE